MANKIKSSDLFEDKLFDVLVKEIERTEKEVEKLEGSLGQLGTKLKESLQGAKIDNLENINKILNGSKEANKALAEQIQLEKSIAELQAKKLKLQDELSNRAEKNRVAEIKLQQAREKAIDNFNKKEQQQAKKLEKESKEADNLANAYKRLEKNTRELKNESKRLGAEMLELEKAGKRNTKEYANLENQYKQTTKSAQEGDKALKKLDNTVGDNFRSVGNYGKALGSLKKVMQNIGYAFGVFEAINFVKQLGATQVKLDSLKLSLQNVSDGTNEFTRNMAFVVNISKQYGQDLLSTIDTYKNFIASTKDSNLALGERQMIYQSLIKSTASLALSNEDTEGTLRAVQQMFAKGKIQAEELTQQLGDRLPSATRIMAKAVGVGTAELFKMMKNGELLADEVMPRFAQILEEEVGKNAEKRLQTIGGAFNLLRTNMTLYIDELQSSFNVNKTFAGFIVKIAKNIDGIISLIGKAIRYWTEYKLALVAVNTTQLILNGAFKQLAMNLLGISSKLKNVGDEAEKSAKASSMLKNAIAGISVGVLAEIAYQLYRIGSGAEMAEDAMQRLNYQTGKGAEKSLKIVQDGYKKYYDTVAELRDKLAKKQITQTQFKAGQKQAQQEFTDFLGGNTETIKKRREEIQRDYDLLLSARKRLVEIQKNSQNYTTAELNNAKDTYLAQSNDIAQKYKIKKAWQDNIFVMNSAMKVEGQLIAFIKSLYGEEKNLSDEIKNVNANMGKNGKAVKKAETPYMEHTKEVADMNTEYKELNFLLDEQITLLEELKQTELDYKASRIEKGTEKTLADVMDTASNYGIVDENAIRASIKAKVDAQLEAEESRYKAESGKFLLEAELETRNELDDLRQEREGKQKDLEEIQSDIARLTKDVATNKSKQGKSKKQDAKLIKEGKDLETALTEAKRKETAILEGFSKKSAEILDRDETRKNNARLKEEKLTKKHNEDIKNINDDANEEIANATKEALYLKAEHDLNKIKQLANSTNELIQMGMDAYVKSLERNISLVEDRMNRLNQSIDFLQQKAATGNITANESLAKAQEDQLNAEKEKAKFQRTIQRMQFAMTIFNAYNSNIQNAKVGENPFTKTITDISALTAFVGSLPTFYEGTDTTIKDALGNPHLQGKDGYVVRVDGSEKVLNPYLSAKTGNLTTRDIAQIAEDRLKGKLTYSHEGASSNLSAWQLIGISDKLDELTSVIKNKPETNIAMGEIVGGVMKIVETTKVANTTTRNIHRFNKKI
jgi:tape measure domain-containing protein